MEGNNFVYFYIKSREKNQRSKNLFIEKQKNIFEGCRKNRCFRYLSWTNYMRLCNWPALFQTHQGATCIYIYSRHHHYYIAEKSYPSYELEPQFKAVLLTKHHLFSLGVFCNGDWTAVLLLRMDFGVMALDWKHIESGESIKTEAKNNRLRNEYENQLS